MATIRRAATLEEHVEMGQAIKDAINAIRNVLDTGERLGVLRAKEIDRLCAAAYRNPAFSRLQSRLEDEMFKDNPWLTNDAISVYYHEDERADADELRRLAHEEG
jgi:hypothetical protein